MVALVLGFGGEWRSRTHCGGGGGGSGKACGCFDVSTSSGSKRFGILSPVMASKGKKSMIWFVVEGTFLFIGGVDYPM